MANPPLGQSELGKKCKRLRKSVVACGYHCLLLPPRVRRGWMGEVSEWVAFPGTLCGLECVGL